MSGCLFTDNDLKFFYLSVLGHYEFCSNSQYDVNRMYQEMYQATQYALESPSGNLFRLSPPEKVKVYQVFNSIFYALPLYQNLTVHDQRNFIPQRPAYHVQYVAFNSGYDQYYLRNSRDSFLFDWMLFNSMTHRCVPYYYTPSLGSHLNPGVNVHGQVSDDGANQIIAVLTLFAIALFAASLTFIALYYILDQSLSSLERLWYNEGWLKAALMMAASAAFGAASTVFAFTVASTPLIALALAAGINPVGVVLAGAICITFMGAGLACLAMSYVYDSIDKKVSHDAIDSSDSARFRLTAFEERVLIYKGIDPIRVKCAMVALRAEIAKELNNESIPSFFSRHFGDGAKVQPLLQKIRSLRSGNLYCVSVGVLNFDCRYFALPDMHLPQTHQQHAGMFQPYHGLGYYYHYVQQQVPQGYAVPMPSAPPYEQPPAYQERFDAIPAYNPNFQP